MRRIITREVVLLCAPIAILGVGFSISQFLHPAKDPNAKIALTVSKALGSWSPITLSQSESHSLRRVKFDWKAEAVGGPEYGYRIGFCEKIVARTKAGTQVLYAHPPQSSISANLVSAQQSYSGDYSPGVKMDTTHNLSLDSSQIPIGAKLEWHGEVVAIPYASGSRDIPATANQIARWANLHGAAYVKKTIPIPFDTIKNSIRTFIQALDAQSNIQITLVAQEHPRRVNRRLVAFDGKTTRVLWGDYVPGKNSYWKGASRDGSPNPHQEQIHFNLRNVPKAWGEVTFYYDVVYIGSTATLNNRGTFPDDDERRSDLATLDKLQKSGGTRAISKLVLRKAGTTQLQPPNYEIS